jgi:DNA-directed RNA polymerase specialized sigma subunit
MFEKKPDKAMKFLGRDYSQEKIMDRLGIEGEELRQAELARLERVNVEYERKREIEPFSSKHNKKDASKALEILGFDPSKQKLMKRLGVDEEIVNEAKMQVLQREEDKIVRQRRNSGSNKRNSTKALEVLGHNPSKEKIKSTLGMDEQDVDAVEQEKVEIYEQECSRKRSNSWLNKKASYKALKVLGLEPSKDKIKNTLGINEEDLKGVFMLLTLR